MKNKTDLAPEVIAPDRKAWRAWLKTSHKREERVWLVLFKKDSGIASVTYEESVEEALCFGWIDSKPALRDAQSYKLFFAKRKPTSVWSAINKRRIEKMMAAGKMSAAGLATIETARANGSWSKIDSAEALVMPAELQEALQLKPVAQAFFANFPPSVKKGIYHWILSARREETRLKRVAETVAMASINQRANQWRNKRE